MDIDTIILTVQNKHMKGNSWRHHDNAAGRKCPLHEALTEAFPDDSFHVGGALVYSSNTGTYYRIGQSWNMVIATNHIDFAQKDENYKVDVELTPIELKIISYGRF